jgi:hypothetical protein
MWYHILNRGNRREASIHKSGDHDAFVAAIPFRRALLRGRVGGRLSRRVEPGGFTRTSAVS